MSFNVFVDNPVTGDNIETFNTARAYDASALANAFTDAGYSVATDLWHALVDDAMPSPAVWERFGLERYPALRPDTYLP
jgi:hypothetical protein